MAGPIETPSGPPVTAHAELTVLAIEPVLVHARIKEQRCGTRLKRAGLPSGTRGKQIAGRFGMLWTAAFPTIIVMTHGLVGTPGRTDIATEPRSPKFSSRLLELDNYVSADTCEGP